MFGYCIDSGGGVRILLDQASKPQECIKTSHVLAKYLLYGYQYL